MSGLILGIISSKKYIWKSEGYKLTENSEDEEERRHKFYGNKQYEKLA